ncbi:MAG: beta-glucosidase, partial [Chitinivibrionales bacterium]|nr:beta-glucosidase [Chitinivibrionales bacterium]
KTGQLPCTYDGRSSGRKYDYVDLRGRQELFPFGFGLSYVRFSYSHLNVTPRNIRASATVSLDIRNRGARTAEEVVQLYLCASNVLPLQPLRRLIAFRRVRIPAGATKTIRFTIGRRELSTLDADMQWRMQPGDYRILAGGNSRDCKSVRFRIV